jgi:formylglycine-generating enzyme required for sulfatase activity
MGKEGLAEPVHDFFVEGFHIDAREVSNRQYREFMDAGGYQTEGWWNPVGWEWRTYYDYTTPATWDNAYYHGGGIPGNEEFPVNGISWWEADAYCRWAGKRLPTEAEWEKAAKGGCEQWGDPGACDPSDTPSYPWGEGVSGPQANYVGSGDPYESDGRTTPVGYYDGSNHDGYQTQDSPGPYGVYDVVCNVYEWCSSEWTPYPYDPDDGREEPPLFWSDCCRVLRGGEWGTWAIQCSDRDYGNPNGRHGGLGFRCASTN